VSKSAKLAAPIDAAVRTRRAYFDCRFGQLHVRTAFPSTGGFDEQVTLFCLHQDGGSSRLFTRFLPLMADDRSVYAPDLPGSGESDASPDGSVANLAGAVADLADDLRLRQIDLLGHQGGTRIATALALAKPELVRRLVLVDPGDEEHVALVQQPCLMLSIGPQAAQAKGRARSAPPNAQWVAGPEYSGDMFELAPHALATQLKGFLNKGAAR
jgi:pimeloyl-ACP methyl ester carboxylesterase